MPILASFISMSIADRPGLAVGFVGGALANAGGSFPLALIAGIARYSAQPGSSAPAAKSLEDRPVLICPVVGILAIGVIIRLSSVPWSALNL
ncbi:MAG: hypothetical protein ACLS8R_04345 [Anaeromassilibacillus sp.]